MRWTGGFYYFDWAVNGDYFLDIPGAIFFNVDSNVDTESWALFGQVEYDITPNWTAIVGLRYTEETKELAYQNFETAGLFSRLTGLGILPITPTRPTPDAAFVFNTSNVGDIAKHDKTNVTGQIELDWRPNDDWLVYAKFSRGAKSAGFNATFVDETGFLRPPDRLIPFSEETLHAYELGFKAEMFNGTTRLNASGFYYDFTDYQTLRFELLNTIIFNTDAEMYGAEIELFTSPWERWDFMLNAAVLDSTAKDVPGAATGIRRDRTTVASPDLTLSGMARYEFATPFGLQGTMAAVASFNYQDDTFYDIQNYEISKADSFIVGNARLQWTSPGDHLTLATFVNNIADEEYVTYTFDFTGNFGLNQLAIGKPRWWGGTIALRY